MKKNKTIEFIKKQTYLPLYILNSTIESTENYDSEEEINSLFPLQSNKDVYQTKKHPRNHLYKPIIINNENI